MYKIIDMNTNEHVGGGQTRYQVLRDLERLGVEAPIYL